MFTQDDIFNVLTQYPSLNFAGGNRGVKQTDEEFLAGRSKLYNSADRINQICDWIQANTYQTRHLNTKQTSYGWKHTCEKDIGYVANGEFILAALLCGYRPRMMHRRLDHNVIFNMALTSKYLGVRRQKIHKQINDGVKAYLEQRLS